MSLRFNPVSSRFDWVNDQAVQINITDTGGYYSGTTVEAALQEIGDIHDADFLVYTANPGLPNAVAISWGNYVQVSGTATANTISVLPDFSDSDLKVHDNGDATKIGRFEASGISAGTTRTYTFPNASGTLALTSDLSAYLKLDTSNDPLTGTLAIVPSSDVGALDLKEFASSPTSSIAVVRNSANTVMWNFNKTILDTASSVGITLNFDTSSAVSSTTGRTGLSLNMNAGYTGSSFVTALAFDNVVLTTSTAYTNDTSLFGYRPDGSRGIFGGARGTMSGVQTGGLFLAGGSNSEAYAVWGAATRERTGGYAIGIFGAARNTVGIPFAGAFVLGSRNSQPVTRATGAALLCDNSDQALDIFVGMHNGTDVFKIVSGGNVAVGNLTPTASLHIKAGTTAASSAPLKFTSGTNMTTAEAGAVEFTTDDLYFTITTGAARKGFIFNDGSNLTSGRVPFATTNGRLTDDADMTFATDTLTVTKIIGSTSIKVGTAGGYISSDGSTGATGTFTTVDGKTVTVKDGIITSII